MRVLLVLVFSINLFAASSAQKPHVSCERKFKKVGCFAEDASFKQLFTDRVLHGPMNEGYLIDWKNWNVYKHSLACRCNEHAVKNGFDYFALRYYGLCLGANQPSVRGSTRCYGDDYSPCNDAATDECVGQDLVDYIYEVGRDGGYSDWNITTPCSKSCGGGTQTRERSCTNPRPSGFGKDCTGLGATSEIAQCNTTPCKVDGGFSAWSAFGSCSQSCGGGNQTRHRECNNPAPENGGKDCEGAFSEIRSCNNELCPGAAGISKAQEIVENFLLNFFNSTYPTKKPPAKFHMAIFAIQQAVANEMAFGTTKENLQQRLNDLRRFLKVATEGGSIEFARSTLAKSLLVFMKKKIAEGLPYNGITIAVNDFLKSIKDDIGDKKFDDLMLINGGATLMFTVDTTGSMKDDIDAAKGIATSIINMPRKFPVDYILSPFNDPGYGPLTYKNDSNKNEFITAMSLLNVFGGRDCPEMSFTGMLEAFKANPQLGSPMFVFTDASPKDDSPANMQKLKTEASQYSTAINFFTNQDGCGDEKGIQSYKEIALHTSGQIFPLINSNEINSFRNYVKTSLRPSVTVAMGHFKATFGRKRQFPTNSHDIQVESGIEILQVTIDVLAKNSARMVVLNGPTSTAASPEITTTYARVFTINNPSPGKWTLKVPLFVGEYSFDAKLLGDTNIDFAAYFLHQEHSDSPVIGIANPLSGPKSTMVVQVSGIEHVDRESMRIAIAKEDGAILSSGIVLNMVGESRGILQASFDTPSDKFKILLSGTSKGHQFQRVSRVGYEASDLALVVMNAGEEFTAPIAKASSKINVYVYNGGDSDTFILSAAAKNSSVVAEADIVRIDKGKNTTVTFDLHPPKNAAWLVGKAATVTVEAIGQSSGKRYLTEVKMIWVR